MKTIIPLLYKDLTTDELIQTIQHIYQIVMNSSIEEENKAHFKRLFQSLLMEIEEQIKRRDKEDIKHDVIEEKEGRDKQYAIFYNRLLSYSFSHSSELKHHANLLLKEVRYRNFSRELIDLRSEVHVLQGLIERFKEDPYLEAIQFLSLCKVLHNLEVENKILQQLLDRYHEQRLRPDLTLNQKAKQLYESYRMAKSFIETGVNVLSFKGFNALMDEINVAINQVTQVVRKRKNKERDNK